MAFFGAFSGAKKMFMSAQPQIYRARRVAKLVRAIPAGDAAGVKLNRVIGTAALDYHDPFLMFDEFLSGEAVTYIEDVPQHPSRGFETITYMLEGGLHHSDSRGRAGEVEPGGAHWMTAGRGVIHSETPVAKNGRVHGVQLWLNLPSGAKLAEPHYNDIPAADIPAVIFQRAEVRLLAGRFHGLLGPIASPATEPFIADISLGHEGELSLTIPEQHQGFIYVFSGGVAIEQVLVNPGHAGLLDGGNILNLVAGRDGARALIATAKPLNEPIVRQGPFVMNSQAEIKQAFSDYRNGLF